MSFENAIAQMLLVQRINYIMSGPLRKSSKDHGLVFGSMKEIVNFNGPTEED